MGFVADNWFDLLQSAGIVASMVFSAFAIREQTRQAKATNIFLITQHHRELWTSMLDHVDLQRIFDKAADTIATPVTERERTFTNMVFLHSAACLHAIDTGVLSPVHGMEADIRDILSYPVPREVWKQVGRFHDKEFASFVDRMLNDVIYVGTASKQSPSIEA